MQHRKIAFIGAGNMTRSIITGMVKAGYPSELIMASNRSPEKLTALQTQCGIQITQDNAEAVTFAEVVVLAVKPQMMADVCADFAARTALTNKLFVSIAAGLPVSRLQAMLGGEYPLVRVMPNTPSLISKGMSGFYADDTVAANDKTYVADFMRSVGEILWVTNENDINGVIAAAGSSPAYFFLFLQSMQEEAMRMGFSADDARLMVQQSMLGAAEMVCQNPDLELSELRAQVTSKGGTTAAAIETFLQNGLPQLVADSMQAAVARAEEMAKQL